MPGAKDPGNDCMECDPVSSKTAYVPSVTGSVCEEDGDMTTQELCNGKGNCEGTARGYCVIDGVAHDAGTVRPLSTCQWCDPRESANNWTNKADGSTCTTDELACTNDTCDDGGTCVHNLTFGCLIEGRCVGVGGEPEGVDCMACRPLQSTDDYSKKGSGEVCSSEEGNPAMLNVCDADGNCTHKEKGVCFIGEAAFPEGESNPANICEVCDPETNEEGWSLRAFGYPCADDGLSCTSSACNETGTCEPSIESGWCVIDNQCVVDGAKKSDDACMVCNPEHPTAYSRSTAPECNPYVIEGGGFSCATSGVGRSVGGAAGLIALFGAAVGWLSRRRRV